MDFVCQSSRNYYKPPNRLSGDARNHTPLIKMRESKTLAIGDSFIGIFKLLKNTANVRVEKIKGGTAKGLFRIGSESNTKLQSIMEGKHHYNCGIFNFGQVDHHISFYWDLIEKQQENDIEYYNTLAHNYVDFIAKLPGFDRKIIFGVYPLPCTTPFVSTYLCCYTRIGDEKIKDYVSNNREKWDELTSLECRSKRIINFNIALERECIAHEIQFASVYDRLVDENHNVLPSFKDPSDCNIHILWEPLILEWCKYFANQDNGISEIYLEDIEQSGQAYLYEKTREVNKWKGIISEEESAQQSPSSNKYVETYVAKDRRNYARNNQNSKKDEAHANNSLYNKSSHNYNSWTGPDSTRGNRTQGYDNRNNDIRLNNNQSSGNNVSNRNSNMQSTTSESAASVSPVSAPAAAPTNLYIPPHLRNKSK